VGERRKELLTKEQRGVMTKAIFEITSRQLEEEEIDPQTVRDKWAQMVDEILSTKLGSNCFLKLEAKDQDELTQSTILSFQNFKELTIF